MIRTAGHTTLGATRLPADGRDHGLVRDALRDYAILDTQPEEQYDSLAEVTARLCGAPIALVTFVDRRREWVKASYGAELEGVEYQRSFGAVTVAGAGRALVVPDTCADDRFAGHPWVADCPRARFYAGVPLTTPGGIAIGTLAVLDTRARDDGEAVAESLWLAARIAAGLLESRREMALGGALTCVVGFDGRFIRVSKAWEDLLGLPAEELTKHLFLDFVHPDDVARTVAETGMRREGGGTIDFENRYVRPDGGVRWLSWQSESIPDEGVFYAVAKDITDRKLGELALRESEERYRLLTENATDMIARHGLDGRFEYVSSASEALVGYSPDELVGTHAYDQIHPEDRASVAELQQTLLRTGEPIRMVFRSHHRDGRWIWTECVARVLPDDTGKPVGFQTASRDMTDAKRAVEARQRAEERFRKAFDEGPVGMAIVGLSGAIERVNRALADLLGYTEQELLELHYEDLIHPDELGSDGIRALLGGERRSFNVEVRLARRDGEPVWISLSVSLMRDGDGEPSAFLAQFLDVSRRRRAEAEARRSRDDAERANRAKSEFLARMSHELRTPLNAILGFGQLLELDDLSGEQRESVRRIVRGGRHLLEVINDVLDISRIEAGDLAIELEPVPTAAIVEETARLVAPLAAGRRITLRIDVDGGETHASADRQRLKQVLLNLVSNAIKYGPEGSEVQVRAADHEGRVRISVTDQGPGVPAEQAERIFAPFERLKEHAAIEGTGLGLALSRDLVRAMGGDIGVRTHGAGGEFWIDLAEASRAAEPVAEGVDDDLPLLGEGGTPGTLLYIEDRESNTELVERVLEKRPDVKLVVATDGGSGIALARERRPDAILLDMGLPDLTGEEVLERLKADPATAAIPVVAITADARPEQEQAALRAGAAAFQTKPIELPVFMRALEDALRPS